MKTNIHFWSYLAHFFLEWEMFQTKVVEKVKTHFVLGNIFLKFCRLSENVEKYCRADEATEDNMANAHCMLDTFGYKHTHIHTHTHTHTHTHSGCVILIAFPLQQWLHERASLLPCTYIACLVFSVYVTQHPVLSTALSIVTNCVNCNQLCQL
jgi:hypothetical protein